MRSGSCTQGESGQAAVEAALILPLTVFLLLGTLQLFMLLQARIMTQYAAFRATRAGSVNHGDCARMTHSAIGALMPTIVSFMGSGTSGTTAGEKFANAFKLRMDNRYAGSGTVGDGSPDRGYDGPIVWIYREAPSATAIATLPKRQDTEFDQPIAPDQQPMRLEVRLVYWYALKIPFVDWVMSRMFLAQWGVRSYDAQNPLLLTQKAKWEASSSPPEAAIASEMASRVDQGQYVFPIEATYTMRMMTPAKELYWRTQNCPPLP